jgi:hypothetical protein
MSDRRLKSRVCVALVALAVVAAAIVSVRHAQDPGVTVSIDAAANRHPISPQVYGLAYADPVAFPI